MNQAAEGSRRLEMGILSNPFPAALNVTQPDNEARQSCGLGGRSQIFKGHAESA